MLQEKEGNWRLIGLISKKLKGAETKLYYDGKRMPCYSFCIAEVSPLFPRRSFVRGSDRLSFAAEIIIEFEVPQGKIGSVDDGNSEL